MHVLDGPEILCFGLAWTRPPMRPWSIMVQALYCLDYLITLDAFSGYCEVDDLSQTTAQGVIQKKQSNILQDMAFQIECTLTTGHNLTMLSTDDLPMTGNWSTTHHLSAMPNQTGWSKQLSRLQRHSRRQQKLIKTSGRDFWLTETHPRKEWIAIQCKDWYPRERRLRCR